MKAMIFLLMIFSSAMFADSAQTEGRYQLGFKIDDIKVAVHDKNSLSEYTDTGDFLKMFGTMVNNSKTYQMFLTYLTTAPDVYQASIDIVKINELQKINYQLENLIKIQSHTQQKIDGLAHFKDELNAYFQSVDVSKMKTNGDGTGKELIDKFSYTKH